MLANSLTGLMPELDTQIALLELEEERRSIAAAKTNSYYCMAAAVLLGISGMFFENILYWIIAAVILLTTGGVLFYKAADKQADYVYSFKQKVMRARLLDLDKNLHIEPNGGLSLKEAIRSGLFNKIPDRLSSEDQITGRIGKTVFCFSEVHVEYKTTTQGKYGITGVMARSF
ncbi:MAG: hypothetical protein ACO1N7_00250 [Sphingobacteriaceae bacterium]